MPITTARIKALRLAFERRLNDIADEELGVGPPGASNRGDGLVGEAALAAHLEVVSSDLAVSAYDLSGDLTITPGDGQLTIDTPKLADGGSGAAIAQIYTFEVYDNRGDKVKMVSRVATASEVTATVVSEIVTDLVNGHRYQVRVHAVDTDGDKSDVLAGSGIPNP